MVGRTFRKTQMRNFVCLYITKQTCMRHVFYRPMYASVPRTYNGMLNRRFLRISRELRVGVNRSVVAKSFNQVNNSRVNKEAWYSFSTFSTG